MHSYVVPNRVVFCEVVGQNLITFIPEYVEVFFPDPITHPIQYHVNSSGYLAVQFTMLFAAELSFPTEVGGWGWPISCRDVSIEVAFWQFLNNPLSSSSVAKYMTLRIILHLTCIGPFAGVLCFVLICFLLGHRYLFNSENPQVAYTVVLISNYCHCKICELDSF